MLNNLKGKATQAMQGADPANMVMQALRNAPVPMRITELAESTGLTQTVLDRVLQTLQRNGQVTCPESGCYSAV